MKSECTVDSLLMFVVGFSVGAGVALLAAPQSGRRTRRQILRRAEDAQEYLEDVGEELIGRGKELVGRARSGLDRARSEVDRARSSVEQRIKEATA